MDEGVHAFRREDENALNVEPRVTNNFECRCRIGLESSFRIFKIRFEIPSKEVETN